jgi:hypothetical protein
MAEEGIEHPASVRDRPDWPQRHPADPGPTERGVALGDARALLETPRAGNRCAERARPGITAAERLLNG